MENKVKENLFIRNPYLAMVIAIVTVLCGLLALIGMPLSQYPDVTPPQIAVTATYPGASASVMLESVAVPLEKQINGVPGLLYLDSESSGSGQTVVTATFETGSDPELCRMNVQDRVNLALPLLPEAVRNEGVSVLEQSGNILLGISIHSPGKKFDTLFMGNYASIHLKDRLERIPGVARAELFGGSLYAMRIWLDTQKCASLGIPPEMVVSALKNQNVQVSSGSIGASPSLHGTRFTSEIRVRGRLSTPEEFGEIVIRSGPDSGQVFLRDVAKIESGAESYATACSMNGENAVMLVVFQRSGGNGIAISDECRNVLKEASAEFPPGLIADIRYDSTLFVREGIRDVVYTLLTAVALVAAVTLLFLRDWRMALVPALAIPVSIVGAFAVMRMIGYSINMVTLFALTLAVGIVVDDAVIVTENVSRLMETENLSPPEAAEKSMRQITGAVTATTAVLLAMFVPVCFFSGITGELYRQFGVTISIAVLLSAFNALTLSPALCSILLKPHEKMIDFPVFRAFDSGFSAFAKGILRISGAILKKPFLFTAIFLFLTAGIFFWYAERPRGFIPEEDRGYFYGALKLPSGSSLERTVDEAEKTSRMLGSLPGVEDVISISGYNVLTGTESTAWSFIITVLKPWKELAMKRISAESVIREIQSGVYENQPGVLGMFFSPPAIPGIGLAGGFDCCLEQTSGPDPERLADVTDRFLIASARDPVLANVFSAFSVGEPALYLNVDREKAMKLGIQPAGIHSVLENFPGYSFVNLYNRFGEIYKVEVQASAGDRNSARNILNYHVSNSAGRMVPFAAFAEIKHVFTSPSLERHNLRLSSKIQGMPSSGYSSSEAIASVRSIAEKVLPENMRLSWSGMSYQETSETGQTPWILAIAVVFIFLFLSALYAGWSLPWTVILCIPPALGCALAFLSFAGVENNLYTQIGFVLLFGMACKTAILVVDFARKEYLNGMPVPDAAERALRLRIRAVSMTSLAFIFGTLPLAFATGPGAGGRCSIGIPVAGGMLGTVFGALILCPVLFVLIVRKRKAGKISLFPVLAGFFLLSGCYTPPAGSEWIDRKSIDGPPEIASGKKNLKLSVNGILTRKFALETAFANNPDYRSALYAVTAAKMRYYQALGAYSPTLTAGLSVGQQLYDGSGTFSSVSESNIGYAYTSVQAAWILFDGLSREFAMLAAKRSVRMNELLHVDARRILEQSVLTAFDEVLSSEAQHRISLESLAFLKEELRQAERKRLAGTGGREDVLNFQSECAEAEMNVVRAENRRELSICSLALLMGIDRTEIPPDIRFPEEDQDLDKSAFFLLGPVEFYLDTALSERPDLNALRMELSIRRMNYYQTWSAFSPILGVFGNYSYSDAFGGNTSSGAVTSGAGSFYLNGNAFNYGAAAYWNIFSGFRSVNRMRELRAELDNAYFSASGRWRKVVNEVRNAYTDSTMNLKLLKLSRSREKTLEQELNLVEKEYRTGSVPAIRLNRIQDQYVRSRLESISAGIALRKSLVRLRSASARNPDPDTLFGKEGISSVNISLKEKK